VEDRRLFTPEQLMVIDALIHAHAEAAREMARLMKPIQEARIAGDSIAFKRADAVHERAHEKCKALKLTREFAEQTFLKATLKYLSQKGE
jgi:hypothetical protein